MKILLLGGGGFVGSAIAKELSQKHEVTCVGKTPKDIENCNFVEADILKSEKIPELIKDSDWVIHLLGGGGTGYFLNNKDAIGDSLRVTERISRECALSNTKLIFTSTVAVYTTFAQRKLPISEDSPPIPDEIYGATKLLSEYMIKESGAPYLIFRIGNIYGFSNNFHCGGVLSKFIQLAADGKPLTVMGGGNKMDYVHLKDLAKAFSSAIEKNVTNEIINIGSGTFTTVADVSNQIKEAYKLHGKEIEIAVTENEEAQYVDRQLSIDKAKSLLDWEPTVGFAEGVAETVKLYLEENK